MLLLVRLTDVPDALLDELNEWYSTVHAMDFVQAPGIISARRFVTQHEGQFEFLALYEHDGSCTLEDTFASEPARRAKKDMTARWSDFFPRPPVEVFSEIGLGDRYDGWRPEPL